MLLKMWYIHAKRLIYLPMLELFQHGLLMQKPNERGTKVDINMRFQVLNASNTVL